MKKGGCTQKSSQPNPSRMQRINSKISPQILTCRHFFSAAKENYGIATLYSCLLALVALSSSAHAVGLGNLDIRSYLGEPLNLRIGVITQANEEIDTNCFTVINAPGSEANVSRRDVRLTLVDTRNSRYLEVRGTNAFNEPIGRLSIRAGCQADSGVVRDYSLLLDPAPLLAPATVNRESATNAIKVESAQSPSKTNSASNWTVYDGDTLSSLARGIHPGSPSRQAQYIAALRSLNPALAGLADNAPLPVNSQLVLPDLKTLSGAAARSGSRPRNAVGDDVAPAKKREPKAKTKRSETKASASGARQTATVANVTTAPATLPTAVARAPVNEEKKPASKAPETKQPASAEGFKLRISGGDLDLSRSQGITDETRTQLRERFAALDADDQTAQLLALKNTVKQIEKRLNEMQLKMATLPASGVTPMAQAEPAAPAATAPPALPATPPAVEKPATEIDAAAKPTPPAAKPATPPKTTQPKTPDSRDSSIDLNTFIVAGLSALAFAALAWWALKRRRQTSSPDNAEERNENASSDEFNTWANDPETTSPSEAITKPVARTTNKDRNLNRSDSAPERNEFARTKNRFAADGTTRSLSANEPAKAEQISHPEQSAKADLEADLEPDLKPGLKPNTSAASFTLPTDVFASPIQKPEPPRTSNTNQFASSATPGDTFDLDLDLGQQASAPQNAGDQISEDRLRRLRYMHERYPELAARTVSIDEPESVINAARLYYEDNQLGKACELLIYAVEERPQEIRFWLAQFELFRLEKMSPQFADLAQKFQLLFGDTNAWPKVRKIGFDLDPANPLYAAGATASGEFDPVSENWLNATVGSDALTQNISEALIADLRSSLFAEHRLTHADFQRGPSLLHAMSERG
jgi:hypothetical protein